MLLSLCSYTDFEPPFEDVLTAGERAHLGTLTVHKRRREWLLGRLALKRLVARWVGRLGDCGPALSDIEVLPDDDRAPTVRFLSPGSPPVAVSLSHRDGLALAGACDGEARFGVDLERVEPRAPSFLTEWFDDSEQRMIHQASGPLEEDRRLAVLWCAKEAVLKAARKGLSVSVRSVRVTALERDRVTVEVDPALWSGPVEVRCWHLPGHVLTWAGLGAVEAPMCPWPADAGGPT